MLEYLKSLLTPKTVLLAVLAVIILVCGYFAFKSYTKFNEKIEDVVKTQRTIQRQMVHGVILDDEKKMELNYYPVDGSSDFSDDSVQEYEQPDLEPEEQHRVEVEVAPATVPASVARNVVVDAPKESVVPKSSASVPMSANPPNPNPNPPNPNPLNLPVYAKELESSKLPQDQDVNWVEEEIELNYDSEEDDEIYEEESNFTEENDVIELAPISNDDSLLTKIASDMNRLDNENESDCSASVSAPASPSKPKQRIEIKAKPKT